MYYVWCGLSRYLFSNTQLNPFKIVLTIYISVFSYKHTTFQFQFIRFILFIIIIYLTRQEHIA